MQRLRLRSAGNAPGQLMNMEQEQARLMQLAQGEKQEKGIFGWMWR